MRNDEFMYNSSGYFDPTAGFALRNLTEPKPKGYIRWFGQPVYICTSKPVESEEDIRFLENCCHFAAEQGAQPIAPILIYAEYFDMTDERMRRRVLNWTRSWLRHASEIWVFDGEPPMQLKTELERSVRCGKAIRYFTSTASGDFVMNRKVQNQLPAFCCREENGGCECR